MHSQARGNMPPIIRNLLIRLSAWIERLWRGLTGTLSRLGQAFGNLAGLSAADYYIEENKSSEPTAQSSTRIEPPQASPATVASRRRAGREADAFRQMAQQIKQEKRK